LRNKRGAIIVLVPKTGEILACVSSPTFDPHGDVARWNVASRQGRASPMLNRAFQHTSPPGSTFKMLVAAAALDSGRVEIDESFECNGYFKPFRNARYAMHDFEWFKEPRWGGHNPAQKQEWTIREAFVKSCNVTFAQIGLELGPELLFEYARRFGFYTDIPLLVGDREEIGLISRSVLRSSIADARNSDESKFGRAQLAQTAVGQYETRTSLLQMALVGAAIANDGAMMKPMLVRETHTPGGRTVRKVKPELFLRPVSVRTARIVAEMMEQVVVRGTGHEAGLSGIRVAGKTGTAQVRRGAPPNAWFVGFAPVEEPRALVAVLLENAGTGGSVAAPVAKEVLQAALLPGQLADTTEDEQAHGILNTG
jgi:peptidoglycan glycosyltransferase